MINGLSVKKLALVAAMGGIFLASSPAMASHVPGFSFNAQDFVVDPTAVGESQAAFTTAGAINFSYTAEVDQFGGATPTSFNETGSATFGAFLDSVGSGALNAGVTGLNLDYYLYAMFSGAGTAVTVAGPTINGTFTSFSVSFYVDRDLDTTFDFGGADDFGGSRRAVDATPADDILVLTGNLLVGGFHASPGGAAGDFDVIFNITGFGAAPFFSTVTGGGPLTQGNINGVNSSLTGVAFPPTSFTDGVIIGSGNVSFQSQVPEPGSLLLVGAALAGLGLSRRRRAV